MEAVERILCHLTDKNNIMGGIASSFFFLISNKQYQSYPREWTCLEVALHLVFFFTKLR